MSMNSGLTRGKHGELLKDGKPHVIGLDTGDDTPVKVDERFDVDINKLVSNEMARQDLLRIATERDFQDLTDFPESRGDAEKRLLSVGGRLRRNMLDGETFEMAMARVSVEHAKIQASLRDKLNNAKAPVSVGVTPIAPDKPVVGVDLDPKP